MSTPLPVGPRSPRSQRADNVQVRLARDAWDEEQCRILIASVYEARYGVRFTPDKVDPDGGVETYPDRYVMGELDGELIACAGLYTRETYVERFGGVTRDEIQAVLLEAGVTDGDRRRRFEYTKIVVKQGWAGRGLGRRFIGATHARDFLMADSGGVPPVLLVCATLAVFRLWDAVGVRTRRLKPFPLYRNHMRYRAPNNPMESRLVIPEIDVDRRWYDLSLPGLIPIDLHGDPDAF